MFFKPFLRNNIPILFVFDNHICTTMQIHTTLDENLHIGHFNRQMTAFLHGLD